MKKMKVATQLSTLSSCVLLLLSGCQSVGGVNGNNTNHSYTSKADDSRAVFASLDKLPEVTAKAELLTALAAHYAKDRVSVTDIYQQEQPLAESGLNQGADTALMSIAKTVGYQEEDEEEYKSLAYRTMVDYLPLGSDEVNEPWVRYYDEKVGIIPSGGVSRMEGLEGEYAEVRGALSDLDTRYYRCIANHSSSVEVMAEDNPRLSVNDQSYKDEMAVLDDCMTEANNEAQSLSLKVTGYQVQDLAELQYCANNYKRDTNEIFAANRNDKYRAYEGDTADYYQLAYETYATCNNKYVAEARSEPGYYIENETSAKQLEALSLWRQCAIDYQTQEKALRMSGKNLRQNADEFMQVYFNTEACVGEAFYEVYDLPTVGTATTMAEVAERYDRYEYTYSYAEQMERYEDYYDEYDDSNYRSGRIKAGFERYFKMKRAELAGDTSADEEAGFGTLSNVMRGRFGSWLDGLGQTPAQIDATNLYQNHPTHIRTVSQHLPSQKRYASLLSYEYEAPTSTQMIRLPYFADFRQGVVRADVSAGLPILALINPKNAPLPKDFEGGGFGVMDFHLPKELQGVISSELIYDAMQTGMVEAMAEISPQAFVAVSPTNDDFARSVGATKAVRVSLNAKEQGVFLAGLSKVLIRELNAYVEAHPEYYEGEGESEAYKAKLKTAIEHWALLDKGFQTGDVGGLLQAVEGVLPLSLYQTHYYYLDNRGNVVGQMGRVEIDIPITKQRLESVALTRFTVDNHDRSQIQELNALMNQAGKDGNAWLQSIKEDRVHQTEAKSVREGYVDAEKAKLYEAEQSAKRNGD